MDVLESIFTRALNLESPWKITKIEFTESEGKIKIFIDFPRGSVFQCPNYFYGSGSGGVIRGNLR